MGTDVLFENHTIKEIQAIEKKLRNDIEKKKEELRQMVGERYRDLMECADTITEMKDVAESVTKRVKAIEERCILLQNGSLQTGMLSSIEKMVSDRTKKNELLYSVASQMKILMDVPSKIWSSIETEDYVDAASLFLLARHTHSQLLLDPIYQDEKLFQYFPIISRQWASINHLRTVLLENSKKYLETQDIKSDILIGKLCCICLLSDSAPQQILFDVLAARKSTVQAVFKLENSAKTQICELVTAVQTTLEVVYSIFYPRADIIVDENTNMLIGMLNRITNKNAAGTVTLLDFKSSDTFKFLPKSILDFRPSLKVAPETCSKEFLQKTCNEWLKNLNTSIKPYIVELLNYVTTVKSLAYVRNCVFDQLSVIKDWDCICRCLLNASTPLSMWEFFLKQCFLSRITDIVENKIKSANDDFQRDVENVMHKICSEAEFDLYAYERAVSSYVWSELQSDIIDNIGWTPRYQRNLWDTGALSMKTLGFTPKVQSICGDLDKRLKEVVQDILYFSSTSQDFDDVVNLGIEKTFFHISRLPSDISQDTVTIYRYLYEAVEKHFSVLASYFETMLLYLENENPNAENSCRIIFLGHLCRGISELCPHLSACLSFSKLDKKAEKSPKHEFYVSQNLTKENLLWKELGKKLMDSSDSAFRLWGKGALDCLLKNLNAELEVCSARGLLKALLKWDKVTIQEETEQGNAVKSVLQIPQQISSPLSNALFSLCCRMNIIGGHTINREVRSEISKQLLKGLLDIYGNKVDGQWPQEENSSRLAQIQSLQILFDIQFLMALMVYKDDNCEQIKSQSQEIIAKVIGRIDPFDMDVFTSPLQQNLKRALQKSLSLFGILISLEQVSYLNSLKPQMTSSQMEHNVMLIPTACSRFPLLPLSVRSTLSIENPHLPEVEHKDKEVKTLQSHSSSPNLISSDIPTNPLKSTSFYDRVTAMSSSWFGN